MPYRLWDLTKVKQLMAACIILHGMIVEDQGTIDPLYKILSLIPTLEFKRGMVNLKSTILFNLSNVIITFCNKNASTID